MNQPRYPRFLNSIGMSCGIKKGGWILFLQSFFDRQRPHTFKMGPLLCYSVSLNLEGKHWPVKGNKVSVWGCRLPHKIPGGMFSDERYRAVWKRKILTEISWEIFFQSFAALYQQKERNGSDTPFSGYALKKKTVGFPGSLLSPAAVILPGPRL